jgi:hypothetical protein
MSRFSIKKGDLELTYGFDHALGYFYDIVDLSKDEDSKEYLLAEKSYFINKMTRSEFSEVLSEWGAREDHLMSIALDLPF